MSAHGQAQSNWNWVTVLIAGILSVGSAAILIGMHIGYFSRFDYWQSMFSMKSHALLATLLAGLSLWLQSRPLPARRTFLARVNKWLAQLMALMVMLIGLASLAHLGLDIGASLDPALHAAGLETYSFADNAMALPTAICFTLAGLALALLDVATDRGRFPAEYCTITMAGIMSIPMIGFLFSAGSLIDFALSPAISPQTPLLFLLLAAGILLARPQHPVMDMFTSRTPGGRMLRSVLPATLILLIVLDLLAEWGARQGLYHADMVSPLVILVDGGLMFLLFWRAARMLNHEYGVRIKGEAELAKTNDLIRTVSDCVNDAIYVKDQQGRIIFANPVMLQTLGKDLSSAIGRTSQELFADAEVAESIHSNDQTVIRTGKSQAFEETITVAGQPRTFHATKSPWLSEQGEVLGIVGISTDITERKRTEDALKQHESQLEALVNARTAEVRELIGHIETMREEEKRAIARELHDDLGSSLTALNMHLAILFQQLPNDAAITERSVQIKALLNSVTATTRRIQNGLRPDKLDIFGIKTAIIEQSQDFENYTGVPCKASLPDEEIKFPPQVEITLFRMVQEALNNIAKHAKATQVDVILDEDDDFIFLTIRDNGIGISANAPPYNSTHGLRGMRERASYLGGKIEITSVEGSGTRIKVILPKAITSRMLISGESTPHLT